MRLRPALRVILVLTILALLIPFTGSAVVAQSPTPVKKAPATVAPRAPAGGQFLVFMPLVQVSGQQKAHTKKGVGLTYPDCSSATASGAAWQYGWSPSPAACAGVENIPMMWGAGDVNATLGGNSQWIMGFNEPDSASQANLSPANAATLWRQIEQAYPTRKLAAPAPSGGNTTWLPAFRQSYISAYGTAPRLDALEVHCYAWSASACIQFTQVYEGWASSWGVPEVWVSEFSISPSAPNTLSQSLQEAQTYINWLEADSMITRFAWFASKLQGTEAWLPPTFITPLTDWNTGQLTTFGTMYVPFR